MSEVVELMAQDVESRHRGFLSQLQYVARLYDPANTGTTTDQPTNPPEHCT